MVRYSREFLHRKGFEVVLEVVKKYNEEKRDDLILECRHVSVMAQTCIPDGCLIVKRRGNLNRLKRLARCIKLGVGCDTVIDVCYHGPQVIVNDIEYRELAKRIEGRLRSFFK